MTNLPLLCVFLGTGSLDSPKARHLQSPIVKRKTSKPSLDVSDIVRDSPDFSKSPHRLTK